MGTDIVERLRMEMRGERHADLACEAADEVERLRGEMHSMGAHMAHLHRMNDELRKVRDTADLLVNECEGGRTPPSLGILARLESALAMEHKARTP